MGEIFFVMFFLASGLSYGNEASYIWEEEPMYGSEQLYEEEQSYYEQRQVTGNYCEMPYFFGDPWVEFTYDKIDHWVEYKKYVTCRMDTQRGKERDELSRR